MKVDIVTSGIKTTARTETLTRYFSDIPNYDAEINDKTSELFRLYKNETNLHKKEEYKAKIINANLLFVISIAKRYSNKETLMDIIQEGNIGLLKALESYNPDKNARFITYAVHHIVREINLYKTRTEHLIRNSNSTKVYYTKAKAKEELFKQYNREPTLEEIQEFINSHSSAYHINNTHDLIGVRMTYVDDDSTTQDDKQVNAGDMSEYNSYTASQNDYIEQTNHEYTAFLADSLLNILTPKEQEIIKYAFGINLYREFSNDEIAQKMGYTSERVRQIKNQALKKLQEAHLKTYKIR